MPRPHGLSLMASIVRVAVPMTALGYALAVSVIVARNGATITSYAQVGSLYGVLDRAAGVALIAVGVYAWFAWPRSRIGTMAMLAGVVWFGPDWLGAVGMPDLVRSIGLLMTPFILPLTAHLVMTATGALVPSSRGRRVVLLLYASVAILTVARAVTYVPFDERYCWAICSVTGNVFLVGGGNDAANRLLNTVWLTTATVTWFGLAIWSARRIRPPTRISQPGRHAVLLASVAVGLAWAAYAAALLLLRDERPDGQYRDLFRVLFLARALATVALAADLAWMVNRVRRRSAAVHDVAAAIAEAPAPGSLGPRLALALADESLQVVFPLDDGQRYIDASGRSVEAPAVIPGRALTPIQRGGRPIAVVVHDSGIEGRVLEQEIGSAARLAVDNERLRAVVLSQLAELRASRTRIVQVGDSERQRIERDLHDGAQQRLLALSFEVRIARAAAERARDPQLTERLDRADLLSQAAIEELRQLAHGIYPAVLADAGLGPALATLSDEAKLPIELDSSVKGRCPAAVEIAAYQVIVDAMAQAGPRGASYLGVRLLREGDQLSVEVTDDGPAPVGQLVRAADRVAAAGGRLVVSPRSKGVGTFIRVDLPCV